MDKCYCDICGREVPDERLCKTVVVEGAVLKVCPDCYRRLIREGKVQEVKPEKTRPKAKKRKWSTARIPRRLLEDEYEIVEDYAERVRRARQRMGWSQAILAQKVREKENVIRRIEAGRLKPSIDLARRLERILGITLLEPIVEETVEEKPTDKGDYYTIGDFVRFKRK
jgi:putative transcription factor